MPLASLPVVILLGEKGPLVFNVLMLVAIVGCLFWLAQRLVSPWAAAVAVALTGIATTLPSFAWGYSGDLFAVLAVLAALVVLPTSPSTRTASRTVFAGVLFGVGAISKLPFLLAAAAASLLLARPRIRSGLLFAAGLSVPLLCFAVLNTHLFGSPFVTSYDRIAIFSRAGTASGWHTLPVGEYFDLPLLAGMAAQLTDAERGLLATTPITVLSFLLVPVLWRLDRPLAVFVTSVSLGLYLFFSTYSLWQTSQHGNRFLLLPVVLGVLPLAAAAQALGDWFRRRRETQRLEAT